MAHSPSVPKFGEWSTNDNNFTSVFENARAQKDTLRINPASPVSNSSLEQDVRDTISEPASAGSDRNPRAVLPSRSPVRIPLSNWAEKSPKRINPLSSSSSSSSEVDVKSSSTELGNLSFDCKSSTSSSPRGKPLSNRAYNRKDYEYIATFSRPQKVGYRVNKNHLVSELSDASTLSISTDDLCESSANSWDYQKENKCQPALHITAGSDTPDSSSRIQEKDEAPEPDGGLNERKPLSPSPPHNQADQDRTEHEASVPAPTRKKAGEAGAQGKFRGLLAGPGPFVPPTALPKFGDWNAPKPYTQIFGQHREEKLGGHPRQPLSLQEQTGENTKPAAPQQKQWLVCGFCFKASAVEE